MKNLYLITLLIIALSNQTNAKVWRINNNAGVLADFNSISVALASTVAGKIVSNADTLYLEASPTNYGQFTLNKSLVIIGAGYFLKGTGANYGLQADSNSAYIDYFFVDSLASGSTFMGFEVGDIYHNTPSGGADNIIITRCKISNIYFEYGLNATNTRTFQNWLVSKCYISNIYASVTPLHNCTFTNNILTAGINVNNANNINNLVRNNVIRGGVNTYNTYFANNLITNSTFTATNSTVKNNISTGNTLPVGNGNLNNQSDAVVFLPITGNTMDGRWQLNVTSPAIGAGETVGAITPNCGPFGTADPYKLSGIPPIPTIYSLTVPASVSSTATVIPIVISTKSNN